MRLIPGNLQQFTPHCCLYTPGSLQGNFGTLLLYMPSGAVACMTDMTVKERAEPGSFALPVGKRDGPPRRPSCNLSAQQCLPHARCCAGYSSAIVHGEPELGLRRRPRVFFVHQFNAGHSSLIAGYRQVLTVRRSSPCPGDLIFVQLTESPTIARTRSVPGDDFSGGCRCWSAMRT